MNDKTNYTATITISQNGNDENSVLDVGVTFNPSPDDERIPAYDLAYNLSMEMLEAIGAIDSKGNWLGDEAHMSVTVEDADSGPKTLN